MKINKLKHQVLFLIIFLGVAFGLFGQNDIDQYLNEYPVEAKPSIFEKYGDFSPPNSAGIVPIDIPLLGLDIHGYKIPVNVNYSGTSGIRVTDKSSSIGLGWQLNINNFYIESTVNNLPDFSKNHNGGQEYMDIMQRKKSVDYDVVSGLYFQLKNSLFGSTANSRDFEPDEYRYNFNGVSGSFFIDEGGTIINISSSKDDLKFERISDSFVITDGSGVRYSFGESINETSQTGSDIRRTLKRRWYLEKIELVNKQSINFEYTDGTTETGNSRYDNSHSYIYREMYNIYKDIYSPGVHDASFLTPETVAAPPIITSMKTNKLKSIDFESGKLELNYYTNQRGGFMLSDVTYKNRETTGSLRILKRIEFNNQNYFKGETTGTFKNINVAPKLTSISISGKGDEVQKYSFIYNETPMPKRNITQGDYWGYYAGPSAIGIPSFTFYNTITNDVYNFEGTDRAPNENYTKAGILKKIIYPTGGYTEFKYEPNYYIINSTNVVGNILKRNVAITAIGSNPSFGSPNPEDEAVFSISNQIISEGGIYVTYNGSRYRVTDPAAELPNITITTPNDYFKEVFFRPDEKYSGTFYINDLYPYGEYKVRAYVGDATLDPNDPQPPILGTAMVELSLRWTEKKEGELIEEEKAVIGGGLRVSEIASYNLGSTNTISKLRKFEYGIKNINGIGVGQFMGVHTQPNIIGATNGNITDENHIIAHFFTKKKYELKHGFQTESGGSAMGTYDGESIQISSQPQFPIEYKGNSVFYGKVAVSDYNIETNEKLGKTEYFYSPPKKKDLKNLAGTFHRSSSAEVDLSSYSQYSGSHLTKEIVFNSSLDTLSVTEFQYTPYLVKSYTKMKLALADEVHNISGIFMTGPRFQESFIDKNMRIYKYDENILVDKLTSTVKYDYYFNKKIKNEKTHRYKENNSYRISESILKNSDQNNFIRNFYYSDDVNELEDVSQEELIALTSMNTTQHRISEPIQTEITVEDINGLVLSKTARRTHYKDWGNGIILPKNILTLKESETIESRIEYLSYDSYGNPTELKKTDGSVTSYFWGYNGEYPIARIVNATYAEIASLLSITVTALKTYTESNLSVMNTLRTKLPNAQVTTYSYEPMVGVKTLTDPKGYTTHYEYDDFNRLGVVKDQEGNLLEDYKYHYKNQP